MKSIVASVFLFLSCLLPAHCLDLDSLGKAAIMHAAHHNIRALRPVYKEMGIHMPHFIKLYCDIAIASSEGRHKRVIECVDSLKQWYPKKLQAKTLLSLAETKAESLRQLGEYEALKAHCNKEIKYFERRRFKKSALKELYYYQNKATRLLGNGTRTEILQYADRNDIFKLDSILPNHFNELDKFAQLRSNIVLGQSFHRLDVLGDCAKSLVTEFADSLDAKELTYCIETYANLLAHKGNWKELDLWLSEVSAIDRGHSANTKYYKHLADGFSKFGETILSMPQRDISVNITYEWPLLTTGCLNNCTKASVALESEQALTLISEKMAKACKAKVLPDTISIVSSMGLVEACPTLLKEFALGQIVFNNILVYCLLEQNEEKQPFDISLGTNDIARLGKISLLPEKLIVHQTEKIATDHFQTGNLYLSEHNGLRVHTYANGKEQPLSLNLGYPYNVLNKTCFIEDKEKQSSTEVRTTAGNLHISSPKYIEEKIAKCNGILGTTFLRSYHCVTLDFNRMMLTVEEPTEYTPSRDLFGHNTDKFYLQRNKQALTFNGQINEEEGNFLELLLCIGKNRPEKVAEISKELREKQSEFYDAYTEAEGLFWSEKYAAAIDILEKVLNNKLPFLQLSTSEQKVLGSVLHTYKLFKDCKPTKIADNTSDIQLEKDKNRWVEIKANGKKMYAVADIFKPYTAISEKQIKKLKVNILGSSNGRTHGIIPLLEIGDIRIENVHCIVINATKAKLQLPNKGKGISLGWDLIRHFKQFGFSDQHLFFSLKKASSQKESASLYRLKDWIVETENEEGFATYVLNPEENTSIYPQQTKVGKYLFKKEEFKTIRPEASNESEGKISMKSLTQKAKVIKFDLENMILF